MLEDRISLSPLSFPQRQNISHFIHAIRTNPKVCIPAYLLMDANELFEMAQKQQMIDEIQAGIDREGSRETWELKVAELKEQEELAEIEAV
eukprot:COSAG05_NODE_12538_length_464_cov_0.646575_2_plen_90_part_01